MIPIVIAVLHGVATPGINIVGMTMLPQFVVSFGFILVVNAPQPEEERAMTSSIKSYPLVDKVIEIFGDWLKQRQEIRELRRRIFVHRLRTLRYTRRPRHICPPGPACHTELPKLLKALGIDEKGPGAIAAAGSSRHGTGLCVVRTKGSVQLGSRGRNL